ncbi:hypothetical protein BMF94_3004 [Rhodotorula taiwanensis]|uniref:DUF1279 domain-containing protein n=1 Tax=Rhodotorula taiwanensis TaxID=741276 RepID=A0A2S5BB53_9BASI|nr:hypothetical protein BMF94_3004 [Rhodotorula taiwanensis]
MLQAIALRSAVNRTAIPCPPTGSLVRSFGSSSSPPRRTATAAATARRPPPVAGLFSQPASWAASSAQRRAAAQSWTPAAAGPTGPRSFFWSSSSSSRADSSSSSTSSSSSHEHEQSKDNSNAEPDDPQKIPLTQKVKYLFRKYGWTTLVVYLGLSAVDFGLCFLVIYSVGADRVRHAEDWVLEKLHWRRRSEDRLDAGSAGSPREIRDGNYLQRTVEGLSHRAEARHAKHLKGAEAHPSPAAAEAIARGESTAEVARIERESAQGGGKSKYGTIATTAVLAYAIHKTLFLPVRVGITVAITPKVVRMLQGWGWKVGMAAGAPPTAAAAAAAAAAGSSSTGAAP